MSNKAGLYNGKRDEDKDAEVDTVEDDECCYSQCHCGKASAAG